MSIRSAPRIVFHRQCCNDVADRHSPIHSAITGGGAGFFFRARPMAALIERDGKVIGSDLIGQNFHVGQIFSRPPFGDDGARSQ